MDMPISMRHRQHFLLVRYTERDNAVRANKPAPPIELDEQIKELGQQLPQLPEEMRKERPKDFMEYLNKRESTPAVIGSEKKTAKRLVDLVEGNAPKVRDRMIPQPPQPRREMTEGPRPDGPSQFSFGKLLNRERGTEPQGKGDMPVVKAPTEPMKRQEANLPPAVRAALEKLRQEEKIAATSGEVKPGLNMDPTKPPKKEVPKELQDFLGQPKKK
jgi:hypothetical protein